MLNECRGERSLLIVVNELQWFWTHRLPLAMRARDEGWRVAVVSPPSTFVQKVEAAGFPVHAILQERARNSVVSHARNLLALYRLYRQARPTVVHHVTIKPVLLGSLAARLARVPAVVNAIAGLGYLFMSHSGRAKALRATCLPLLRMALGHPRQKLVFQNGDDREVFLNLRLAESQQMMVIRGAGVDLETFAAKPLPTGTPTVLMPARVLRDKGVGELVAASRILKRRGVDCRVVICGEPDPGNPTSIPASEIAGWEAEGIIQYLGQSHDMVKTLSEATVVVLPSYREGLPKVLLEAAAVGRPIITTDVPGCREVVRDGVNGLLVPVRDAAALAHAIESLARDPMTCQAMGAAGRLMAEREFDVKDVAEATVGLYDALSADIHCA